METINNRAVDVRVFRLSTGEEAIARVSQETSDAFVCSAIRIFMQDPTSGAIIPAQISMVARDEKNPNQEVRLFKTSVMAEIREISDELYNKFVEGTSGIALA